MKNVAVRPQPWEQRPRVQILGGCYGGLYVTSFNSRVGESVRYFVWDTEKELGFRGARSL